MINSFETLFEARERKFQQEKLFRGESVDLVARITTDGVPDTLNGYAVEGYYQPIDYVGTDNETVFYSVPAEISDGKVIVHWTYDKDFGKNAYSIWALLTKSGEQSYPVCWRLAFAHSPSYPPGETPEPIPQTLDFSKYTLLNAPWLPLEDAAVSVENLIGQIDGVKDSLSDYLPLSGGTVDWLSVDSANFNVKNLLSASTREDGKMGSLFIGSDIRDYKSGGGKLAPIIIGNDAASYGAGTIGDFSYPNIALGNDNVVEPNGIVIGGACGRKYEYDLGTGTGSNPTDTPIFNPKRENIDLNDLVFLDENGDPLTSFNDGDKIILPDETGVHIIYYRHATTHHWGRIVPKRVGKRIQNVWTEDGVLTQNAEFYYLRSGNTGGNIKLHFEPDPINSVDHSAAAGFSIAIGNDTMAGGWISADVFQGWRNPGAIAIGHGTIAKDTGTIALGTGNLIEGIGSIGIGFNANTSAYYAIQLGTGTNSTKHSLQYEDTQIVAKTYDASLSAWANPKLNPDLLPDGLVTEDTLSNALSDYYTKEEADETFLTEHQSLSNYYDKTESDGKFALKTEIPAIVAPSPNAVSGTAASARSTGTALDKRALSFQPSKIRNCRIVDNYWAKQRVFVDDANSVAIAYTETAWTAFNWADDTTIYQTEWDNFDNTLTVHKGATDLYYQVTFSTVALLDDVATVADAKNMLPYADSVGATISLTKRQSVYRYTNSGYEGTMILPNIGTEGIPTSNDYFCFEIELTIPSGITTLDSTAWASVTWLPGFELPQYDYAGKTLYMSCRLDCQTRGITASCWRVA